MENKIYFNQYVLYGLNRKRSFLRVPKGKESKVCLNTADEIQDFSVDVLTDHSCDTCALFYVFNDGTYGSYFKVIYDASEDMEDIEYAICKVSSENERLFEGLDGEIRFCCYSILIDKEDGVFEICV